MSVQRSLSFHAKVYYRPHIVLETNPLLSYSTIKEVFKDLGGRCSSGPRW